MSKKLTLEFIKLEIESEGFMLLSESYENAHQKLQLRCPFGHKYRPVPWNKWQQGGRCTICSGREALEGFNDLATTHPDLAKEWHPAENGNLKPQQVTAGSHKKVWWMCELGHKWDSEVFSRSKVNGSGCPDCNESKGEKAVGNFLTQSGKSFEREKEFEDCKNKRCLRFDFYLPSHELCIEYQGKQHYEVVKFSKSSQKNLKSHEETKKNDDIKLNYCKEKCINLLTISYEHFDNIEDIIKTYFTDSTALIKYSGVNLYTTQSVQKL